MIRKTVIQGFWGYCVLFSITYFGPSSLWWMQSWHRFILFLLYLFFLLLFQLHNDVVNTIIFLCPILIPSRINHILLMNEIYTAAITPYNFLYSYLFLYYYHPFLSFFFIVIDSYLWAEYMSLYLLERQSTQYLCLSNIVWLVPSLRL